MSYGATKEFIEVGRLLERFSLRDLTAAILHAINIGTTSVEAIALICQHHLERPVELFGHIPPEKYEQNYYAETIGPSTDEAAHKTAA